ncbi:ABC transporter ATP-binding protein [Desulfococcaceae bacterium HSG9]|nr:ABC transporter ATP-binding protein [Desulfococcaceae bacterium HSG9]
MAAQVNCAKNRSTNRYYMTIILKTERLTKKFGGLTAVDHVNMTLSKGELRCIIGPNGCGKSTLFNLITGTYKPTSGRIAFKSKDITGKPVHIIGRMGIGRKFQVPGIFNQLTVYDNIRVPFFRDQRRSLFLKPRKDSDIHQKITALLQKINLDDKACLPAIHLAHGEKQWLEIGMVLARRPQLMLLDEPTAGMTAAETRKTAQLIRNISREEKMTILVIEHDIGFVREIASRITVLYKGAVFKEGSYETIQSDEAVRKIYLGKSR